MSKEEAKKPEPAIPDVGEKPLAEVKKIAAAPTPKPPVEIKMLETELQPVLTLRKAMFDAANALPPGHPVRGSMVEALLVFQLNARAEFKP